jgi:hypothetical protein
LQNKDEQDQLKMWVRTIQKCRYPVILTSSLESESQVLFTRIQRNSENMARIQRTGVINGIDSKFVAAIKATGKKTSLWWFNY